MAEWGTRIPSFASSFLARRWSIQSFQGSCSTVSICLRLSYWGQMFPPGKQQGSLRLHRSCDRQDIGYTQTRLLIPGRSQGRMGSSTSCSNDFGFQEGKARALGSCLCNRVPRGTICKNTAPARLAT